MSGNKLFELWLGNSTDLSEKMVQNKINVPTTRDFFFETVLKKYIPDFLPADVKMNEHGKPYLPKENISFNMSHCENQIALLVCEQESCGIDIQMTKEEQTMFDNSVAAVNGLVTACKGIDGTLK